LAVGNNCVAGTTPPTNWIDGSLSDQNSWWQSRAIGSGDWLSFDFGAGNLYVIDEVKYYQELTTSHGTWQFQGSLDNSAWTNIGSSFVMGGITVQTITTMSGNSTGYRYYRFLGSSGNQSSVPYVYEFEFKIGTVAAPGPPMPRTPNLSMLLSL
jgi:hypothetical protein